jgi:hypothetical protein
MDCGSKNMSPLQAIVKAYLTGNQSDIEKCRWNLKNNEVYTEELLREMSTIKEESDFREAQAALQKVLPPKLSPSDIELILAQASACDSSLRE